MVQSSPVRLLLLIGLLGFLTVGAGVADEASTPAALPLVYRGMMGDTAVVEDLETTTQESLKVGETIRGARVVDIRPGELLLESGGRRITLTMGDEETAQAALSGGGDVPPCPWLVPDWARELDQVYAQAKVDLSFRQGSVEEVVGFLRRFTGTSILIDPAAQTAGKGPFSYSAKGVTVHQALDQLLPQFGLELVYQDNVAVVTTAEKAATNPIRRAWQAQAGLAEARRRLERLPPIDTAPAASDLALRDRLASMRLTATFENATLHEVAEFLHETAGVNVLIDAAGLDPAAEENRITVGVKAQPVREFLNDLARVHDWGWYVREGFVVVTGAQSFQAREEKKAADEEADAARVEKEAAVLDTPLSLTCEAEPLFRAAQRVSEAAGVPVVIDPRLWGSTPKVTFAGGKTLQDFVDALEKNIEVRTFALRGTLYVLP